MKIWSVKLHKDVYPKDLPMTDLVRILNNISIDTDDSWMPEQDAKEGYAAIKEAIRRLKSRNNQEKEESNGQAQKAENT